MKREGYSFKPTAAENAAAQHLVVKNFAAWARALKGDN